MMYADVDIHMREGDQPDADKGEGGVRITKFLQTSFMEDSILFLMLNEQCQRTDGSFVHTVSKLKFIVVIFSKRCQKIMWNYLCEEYLPCLISAAALPCKTKHLLRYYTASMKPKPTT